MAEHLAFGADGQALEVSLERIGRGPQILMLPAPSSVSSRAELLPLAGLLAADFELVVPDWPGFGLEPTPPVRWQPRHFQEFLAVLAVRTLGPRFTILGAGHAAAYALDLAARMPGRVAGVALVAPTWRGPLPTVAGGYRPWQARVRAVIETPALGEALYRLNVSRPVLAMMMKGHVLADRAHLTPSLLAAKAAATRRRGARFATAAFVTGGLDLARSREDFFALARMAKVPILALWGPQVPSRSGAEMAALAGLPGVRSTSLPAGALGVHEEYPAEVAAALRPFLRGLGQ